MFKALSESGRKLADSDSSVAPIKSSPSGSESAVEDQEMVSVGGFAASQAPAPANLKIVVCSAI